MSKYQFHPAYAYRMNSEPYCCWHGALDPHECMEIIEHGNKKTLIDATINSSSNVNEEWRRSKVAWFNEHDVEWLYPKIEYISQQLNGQFYDFDLWGFNEDMQYTVYEESDEGFYDWHADSYTTIENNIDLRLPRKMSLTIQLSDPDDYEGGDLEINAGGRIIKAPRTLGLAVAFPSYQLHRVTPVTKGTRRSLVVWITGPRFR